MLIRSLFACVLALVLAFTSQSMAVAKGASAATGQMVLCTGAGVVTVHMDAQGKPTAAPHICPDCAFSVLPYGAAPTLTQVQNPVLMAAAVLPDITPPLRTPHHRPPQRAPPLTV